ncbi:DEGP9 [Symbiodinium natans]|uniref:DEGP9 protein n=1 Tax=Symbiodinium natans TaxID=878477 RepID=A0A812QPY4_9DINO|nr:DEGP9 [Symbiodinium natans]
MRVSGIQRLRVLRRACFGSRPAWPGHPQLGQFGLRPWSSWSSWSSEAAPPAPASPSLKRGRGVARSKRSPRPAPLNPLNAVFKVLSTHCEPYYTMPWSTSPQTTAAASALALEVDGVRYLVTNAHAVHHASLLELQKPSDDLKCLARVLCQGPDCDLALLELVEEEPSFWENVEPLSLSEDLCHLNDRVRVCGFPVGGENISITEGIVSRVEMQPYRHGLGSLLAIQIDAAINPGNSGGPALDAQGRCVGVAFQSLQDADNIGYLIPAEVLRHFLSGYRRCGGYAGFGHHGFAWQPLDNRALREAVLRESGASGAIPGGVLVKRIEPTSPASELLRERDVLLSIAGRAISSGGTVHFRGGERIAFPYITSQRCPHDTVECEVLRDSKVHHWRLKLGWPSPLVPMHPLQPPAYLIFGGLVFVPLSEPYLRSEWGELFEERAPVCLAEPWLRNIRRFHDEEVVVLSCVFASALTAGLTHFVNRRLHSCNGEQVRNLLHLANLLDAATTSTVWFALDDDDVIALPTETARASTRLVLETNLIPAARSLPAMP